MGKQTTALKLACPAVLIHGTGPGCVVTVKAPMGAKHFSAAANSQLHLHFLDLYNSANQNCNFRLDGN